MAEHTWRPSRKKYGVAIFNFAGNVKDGLRLQIGETVHILEEYGTGAKGWYRGLSLHQKGPKGIFPAALIHIKECEVDNEGPHETITPVEDSMVKEVTYVLREWYTKWKSLFIKWGQSHITVQEIRNGMLHLLTLRGKLISAALSHEQAKDLRQEIATLIDWGDGKLGMDLVPRVEGEQVDPDQYSVTGLYRLHAKSASNTTSDMPKKRSSSESMGMKGEGLYHLLINFKSSQCAIMEESVLYLSVYSARERKFISEQFEVCVNKNGLAQDTEKLSAYYGLFTDLSKEDLNKTLFIVIKIYRCGKMLATTQQKGVGRTYRRPFGVGILKVEEVRHMSSTEKEYETMMKVTSCVDSENSFPDQHEKLIMKALQEKQGSRLGASFKEDKLNLGVTFSFKMFQGDLQAIKTEEAILFSKGVTLIPKLSFTDLIINPGQMRNDIYLTLVSGEYERGKKKSEKNVEIVVTAFDKNGEKIKNCMSFGCGEKPQTHFYSTIYYHDNSPQWNETVRLSVPMEMLPKSQIRFDIYHCSTRGKESKKLVGFAFLCVTDAEDIVIQDGSHDLSLFQCEDISKVVFRKYCGLPFLFEDMGDVRMSVLPSNMPYRKSAKEKLTVITQLCSTKYTQTSDLLGLLQWKLPTNRQRLPAILNQFSKMEGVEIMKFLPDVLDSLFAIMTDGSADENTNASKVFQVLVYVLNLLRDSRFVTFLPVLENYLSDQFSSPVVHRYILKCFSEGIHSYCDGGTFTVSLCLKVLEQILRFVVRSRELQLSLGGGDEMEFKKNLQDLFAKMGELVSRNNDRIKISQMALLSNLHRAYGPLQSVLTRREMAELVVLVITRMPKSKELPEDVQRNKLDFIQETVNSELFEADESRGIILPLCLSQIKYCMIEKFMLPQVTSILGDILNNVFHMKQKRCMQQDMKTMVLSVFEVILQTVLALTEKSVLSLHHQGELISCLVDMLRLMDEDHYEAVMKMFPEQPPLKDFLLRVFLTFQELIKPEVFPQHWTVMRLVTNNVIFTAVEYFSQALTKHFLHSEDFDSSLWQHYFNLSVAFITQPSLQLEKYSEAKRKKTKERYNDMRVPMGYQMQTLWEKLGNNQRHFIPSLIGPFLEVTLVPEHELRSATLPIFYDMMKYEQRVNRNFLLVENEMIEKLDIFITTCSKGDNQYRELFRTILLDKVQADPTLQENGSEFILSVTSLLERLLDYRNVYDGEDNGDRRMQSTFNILNFYKDNSNRQEMYMRYIKKLYDLHLSAKNYVEAGLTLQLYAKLLNWTDDIKQGEMGYHSQPEWERKEGMYQRVIECFDKGKVWEFGIPLCKELAKFYEERLEYRKLSQILQKQAAFFSKILDGVEVTEDGQKKFYPRQKPSFFRVAYYGRNFPPFVRNKAFVYRGHECLKLQDIINQLTQEFPTATIMKKNTNPTEEMKEGEELIIQICGVKPVAEERPEFRSCPNAAKEIKQFYNANDVDTFQFDKSFYRGEKDKNNEFKSLCTERVLMKTSYKFPGILQWYEVVSMETVTLNPLETAIEAVTGACHELKTVVGDCQRNPNDDNIKHLSMLLNGMISANVMGGIPKYQEAFFSNDFSMEHPEETHLCPELKRCIKDQVRLLDQGLKQMKRAGHKDLTAMVNSLEDILKGIKQSVEDKTTSIRRSDSGNVSMQGHRASTPSSLNSTGSSNRSSECSVSIDTLSHEDIYTDPEECPHQHPPHQSNLSPLIPPPPPEKRRHSQHFPVGSSGQHVSFGSPRVAVPPPIPSRPHSLCLNGLAAQQLVIPITPRHGSDSNIRQTPNRPTSNLSIRQEGDYLYPEGSPSPCSKESKKPKEDYVTPLSPPIPIQGRHHSFGDSPPPSPSPSMMSSVSTPALPPRRHSESGNDENPPSLPRKEHPPLPVKTTGGISGKKGISRSGPPLPPRQPTTSPKSSIVMGSATSLSRSTSSVSASKSPVGRSDSSTNADYKQLEVVSNDPPPIPQRHSQRRDSPVDRKSTVSVEFENTPL